MRPEDLWAVVGGSCTDKSFFSAVTGGDLPRRRLYGGRSNRKIC